MVIEQRDRVDVHAIRLDVDLAVDVRVADADRRDGKGPVRERHFPGGLRIGGRPTDLEMGLEHAGDVGDRRGEALDDAQVHRAAVDREVDPRSRGIWRVAAEERRGHEALGRNPLSR